MMTDNHQHAKKQRQQQSPSSGGNLHVPRQQKSSSHEEPAPPQASVVLPPGICCFLLKYGKCEPPRPPCRFPHCESDGIIIQDDGVTPCCFGAKCRLGHAKRVMFGKDTQEQMEYWKSIKDEKDTIGESPAVRDATLLRSQLEPWPTAVLRKRLVTTFGGDNDNDDDEMNNEQASHRALDVVGRAEIMRRLLEQYEKHGPRKVIRVNGTPVRPDLIQQLSQELHSWRQQHHNVNTRPSIAAKSYMILRSPREFNLKMNSNKAKQAAKKLAQYQTLWNLAQQAIQEVDPEYAEHFSALAVTYGFTGSPHIDKQNTGPFYGLSMGSFQEGQGGICVEASPLVVAHVNTKNRLGKVDGRFPHWVAPYDDDDDGKDGQAERYSLIYYSTWQKYQQPTKAYFGEPIGDLVAATHQPAN